MLLHTTRKTSPFTTDLSDSAGAGGLIDAHWYGQKSKSVFVSLFEYWSPSKKLYLRSIVSKFNSLE